MTLKEFLPHGLVQLREIAGRIYRVGGQSRWSALRTAINKRLNWEWRWSHLDLFGPQVLGSLRTVVDAGANDGAWTNNLLRYAHPEQVLVVEPNPQMKPSLDKLSAQQKCVTVHNAAVGEKKGMLPFHLTNHPHDSSVLRPIRSIGSEVAKTIDVPVVTLDDLTASWTEISLLKLDIQGAELLALRGGQAALKKTRYLFIEVNFMSQYEGMTLFPEIHTHLTNAGFELVAMSEPLKINNKIAWADALYEKAASS